MSKRQPVALQQHIPGLKNTQVPVLECLGYDAATQALAKSTTAVVMVTLDNKNQIVSLLALSLARGSQERHGSLAH